jgi:hypothetical protein
MKTIIKNGKNNQMKLVLLLMVMVGATNMQAQIRVGGSIAPDTNAILDLNADNTDNGTKGLLLPRVKLVSTTNASPLDEHVQGMYVYNTASVNDVLPGAYYNDGQKWVRTGEGSSEINITTTRARQFKVIVNEEITTQSMIISGEILEDFSNHPHILNVLPIWSDEDMAQDFFTVIRSARNDDVNNSIKWRVRVSNSNINSNKSCTLLQLVISYECDHEDHFHGDVLNSTKNVRHIVGQ